MGDDTNLLAERRESWTRFWATGALHSCIGSFEGNYSGQITEAWHGVLDALPEGARVLDLCTGNGALPALFLASPTAGRIARVAAVDLAAIRPDWAAALPPDTRARLDIRGGVRVEALPFDDASFDLVVSQFGIEYTDRDAALAEARRVLVPGGRLALVLHDPASVMCGNAREERTHLAWLAEQRVIDLAAAVCRFVATAATPAGRQALAANPAAEKARLDLNAVMAAATLRAQDALVPDVIVNSQHVLFEAIQSSMRSGRAGIGLERLEWLRGQLAASDLRLAELLDCAMDGAALDAFLADSGFTEETRRPLAFPNGDHVGWWLVARRAD